MAKHLGINIIGIEVRPIHINTANGEVYPLLLRDLRYGFVRALQNGFFRFTNEHTTFRPPHFLSLGRLGTVKAVWEVDRKLAEICNGFDFLMQVTPVNNNAAWSAFRRGRYSSIPQFIYRPLPIDPELAKRRLYQVPIERIEDPTLAQLCREQQHELDRKLTMLIDRGTPRFKYGSLQLYGDVEKDLLETAVELLEIIPPRSREKPGQKSIDAGTFALRAAQELDYFRQFLPELSIDVSIREDITGLMVSQGNLLVGKTLKVPEKRVEALIQHEVGTHVLTYLNGKSQPFQQLYIGLPGYEKLQEGLAVFGEYMAGGLTRPRLRLLAARVLAVHSMVEGAAFEDVFHQLNREYGFAQRTAFNIALRTYRSGGLTKDAEYLRGFVELLAYLRNGGALEPLFAGKIAAEHIGMIRELQLRKVLNPAPLYPRYLRDSETAGKLEDLRNGLISITTLARREK